uniref:Uncharacterized protein n=1 Tax=Tanacetum cinerariifolium TaxID=118510 RepID=A0A699H0P0_TANCI|nr:hypothetical protein [Tanacetum cinerariifolium]
MLDPSHTFINRFHGEVNVDIESGTKKLREKLSQEEDSEEEALEEFNSTLDNVLEKLSQEKDKSCEHFGWDWPENDSTGTEVDWQDDPLHETEDFFIGLDQSIQVVLVQNNVYEEVAEEVIEMANDQAEALSDQEVTNECLDDEQGKDCAKITKKQSKPNKIEQEIEKNA